MEDRLFKYYEQLFLDVYDFEIKHFFVEILAQNICLRFGMRNAITWKRT